MVSSCVKQGSVEAARVEIGKRGVPLRVKEQWKGVKEHILAAKAIMR